MKIIQSLYLEFTSAEGRLFRYALAFSFLLALAPSLIVFALLFRFAYLDIADAIAFFFAYLPTGTSISELIAFFEESNVIPAVTTTIASFWMASRMIYSFLMISANHDKVELPKFALRLQSIILFLTFAFGIVITIIVGTILKQYLPLVSSLCMVILFLFLYRSLSFRKRPLLFGLTGAIFATAGIFAVVYLYLQIITAFFHYDTIYGPLGSLVTLLLAIYVIASVLYFGFCLNLVLSDDYEQEDQLPLKHEKYYQSCICFVNRMKKIIRRR